MQEQIDRVVNRVDRLEANQTLYMGKHDRMDQTLSDLKVSSGIMQSDLHNVRSDVKEMKSGVRAIVWLIVAGVAITVLRSIGLTP